MKKRMLMLGMLFIVLTGVLAPQFAYADFGDGSAFESRMESLQNKFINVVLPLMSILGLVYAGILAASGNETAKAKISVIIIGCIMGFLAPHIIGWLKAILG